MQSPSDNTKLDRTSAVPLYHQLQEVLKQQIESGRWRPGGTLPSEPQLAKNFGVSRVVVRMALGVLEGDHQIVRIRGRGTFVSQPKLTYRAGGLARMLEADEGDREFEIMVLDRVVQVPERSVQTVLWADEGESVLRLHTLIRLRGTPLATGYSFFKRREVAWLEEIAVPGSELAINAEVAPRAHGIHLARSEVSIESATADKFDAEHFNLPVSSPEFLISVVEHRYDDEATRPFELARFGYRADLLQFKLEVEPEANQRIQATWALVDSGWPPSPDGGSGAS